MSWHANQFFHVDEIISLINSARNLFNNTDPKSYTEEERIFIPGTSVKISIVFKGKQVYVPGVIRFFRDVDSSRDIVVAVCVGNDIYTEFSFKNTDSLILDPSADNKFETYVAIDKERLNGLA